MHDDWNTVVGMARAEVAKTLRKLPDRLRSEAQQVPVLYHRLPSRAMEADGIADDTLGLFVGRAFDEEEYSTEPLPPQILLFLENLWEYADRDEATFLKEVRATYLHELGHFLGLDELDLEERGLE